MWNLINNIPILSHSLKRFPEMFIPCTKLLLFGSSISFMSRNVKFHECIVKLKNPNPIRTQNYPSLLFSVHFSNSIFTPTLVILSKLQTFKSATCSGMKETLITGVYIHVAPFLSWAHPPFKYSNPSVKLKPSGKMMCHLPPYTPLCSSITSPEVILY